MKNKYTDLMTNGTTCSHTLEDETTYNDPESMLIAAETARLAGEDFEGCGMMAFDFGYHTPYNAHELVEALCRRQAISREEKLIGDSPDKSDELKWKRKVRRRKLLIERELPSKLRFYRAAEKGEKSRKN